MGTAQSHINPYITLIITTIVVSNLFYLPTESLILTIKWLFKHQDFQNVDLKINKYEELLTTWSCGSR